MQLIFGTWLNRISTYSSDGLKYMPCMHDGMERIPPLTKKLNHLRYKKERLDEQSAILAKKISYLENTLLRESNLINSEGAGVYLIKCHNLYKIGMTTDMKSRFIGLQTSSPYPLKLVAFISCHIEEMESLEFSLHETFRIYCVRGEWFSLNREHLKSIMKMAEERGYGHVLHNLTDFLIEPLEVREDPGVYFDFIPSGDQVQTPSSWDYMRPLVDIFRELRTEYGPTISRDVIVDACISKGIRSEKANDIIERMKRDGDAFEPRPGFLKLP